MALDSLLLVLLHIMILMTVLSIASKAERSRAFNTSTSHICAVLIFEIPATGLSMIHKFGKKKLLPLFTPSWPTAACWSHRDEHDCLQCENQTDLYPDHQKAARSQMCVHSHGVSCIGAEGSDRDCTGGWVTPCRRWWSHTTQKDNENDVKSLRANSSPGANLNNC